MLKATNTEPNSLTNSIPAAIKKFWMRINAVPKQDSHLSVLFAS